MSAPPIYLPRFLKKPSVIGWLVFSILLLIVTLLSYQRYLLFDAGRTRELNNAALNARDKLKAALNYSLTATSTLSFTIRHSNERNDFDSVAKRILETNRYIDALELVENGTITHVFPLKGNEAAIGYDILNDPAVNKEAFKAINENNLYFAGPLMLKQGYEAIVGRLPIFTDKKFQGFAAVLIKLSTLIHAAGLDSTETRDYMFQLSKIDPNTGTEQFFLPNPQLFRKKHSVSVDVAEGNWRIYTAYVKSESIFSLLPFTVLGLLLAISGGLFAWFGAKQPYRLQQQVREKTKQLQESEKKYFSFFDNASDAIIVTDNGGTILDVNTTLCRLLNFSKEELIGTNISRLISRQQLETDPLDLDFHKQGKELIREIQIVKKNGELVEFEIGVKKIDANRNLAIGRDLTGLREAQKKIALSESTLRGAFEYSAVGMALVLPDGKWLKVNDALCQLLGYSQEEMLGMTFKDITHPDDIKSAEQFLAEAIQSEARFYQTEKRYIGKYGATIWVNLNVSSVRDSNGKLLYFVTQAEDITDKKKVATLLEEREKQLRLFIEHSPAALAMFDNDMRYIITSKRWLSDYNLEGKQVIGKNHYDLFPNIPQRWKEIHQKCLKGAVEKSDEDFYIDDNGKSSWLKWEVHPWRGHDSEIRGIIIFTETITKLKEAELKFRNLVEQSLAGVYIVQNGCFAYVNPRFAEIYGYAIEEMINTFPVEFVVAEESRAFALEQIKARIEGKIKFIHYEAKGRRKSGEIINVEAYGSLTTYNGEPAIIGTLLDITERKKGEEILLDSEEKRRMIMDSALDAIISIDESGAIIYWNPQAESIFGWSGEEVIGTLLTDNIIPHQHREHHHKGLVHYRKTGEGPFLHRLIELSAINKSGHEFPVELTIIPIIQKNELSFTAFVRDISERKKAQEKLIESEAKFRNLVEKSLAGVYILQEGKVKYINPAHHKIMGYSLQELQKIGNIEILVHEDDLGIFRRNHFEVQPEQNLGNQYVIRAVRKNGAIAFLEITTSAIVYEGKPALIGTMLDITDRIQEQIRINTAVIEAQEKERRQIGMELHDNVKQILAASLLNIGMVKSNLGDKEKAAEILDNLRKYTTEAIDELRRLSHQLSPSINTDDSFQEQIERLIHTMNIENRLKIFIDMDEIRQPIRSEIQTALYRILQEQFNNILKHAEASVASISIRPDSNKIMLTIRDNGKGFDTSVKKDGIGLENIKRRAFALGGKADVISIPGKGCEINVQIPLN